MTNSQAAQFLLKLVTEKLREAREVQVRFQCEQAGKLASAQMWSESDLGSGPCARNPYHIDETCRATLEKQLSGTVEELEVVLLFLQERICSLVPD